MRIQKKMAKKKGGGIENNAVLYNAFPLSLSLSLSLLSCPPQHGDRYRHDDDDDADTTISQVVVPVCRICTVAPPKQPTKSCLKRVHQRTRVAINVPRHNVDLSYLLYSCTVVASRQASKEGRGVDICWFVHLPTYSYSITSHSA